MVHLKTIIYTFVIELIDKAKEIIKKIMWTSTMLI